MSTRLANEVRPVGMPAYCSACYGQDSSLLYVDFDAACDRGYGDRDDGTQIALDDLILCQNCIRAAAVLVGMRDGGELQVELDSLTKRLRQEQDRADGLERYLGTLETAFETRPEPIVQPRRRGRPPGWLKDDDAAG